MFTSAGVYVSTKDDRLGRTFTTLFPQHVKEAMIIVGWLFIQTEVLALLMVNLWLDGV